MNDASKQALLSAVRSLLIVIGSSLVARGFISDGSVNEIIGAVMVILPIAWGMWDKFRSEKATKAREVVAVNAGIVVADATVGPTPKATSETAEAIIEIAAPLLKAPNQPKEARNETARNTGTASPVRLRRDRNHRIEGRNVRR